MKINISSIRDQKGESVQDKLTYQTSLNTIAGREITPQLNINAKITYTGQRYFFEGEVEGAFEVLCDRCLQPFRNTFSFQFTENYIEGFSEEIKDEDVYFFNGDFIDVTKSVVDALIANLPLRFLCDEKCPGLCPKCGRNLSQGLCDCSKEEFNPAFMELQKLLKPDKEV